MPRIQQLSPAVITKIAAGEVIERPASVVKELLENAVDAGSTQIIVEVEQGGVELLRVVDNGCGIHPDDLPLAFASHATSKLGNADDLFQVRTLGFRGEALASIGGVAQVTLQSRLADRVEGAEIACQGGVLSVVRPWNGAAGTRVEVRHLFYNTPVRRKFLRTTPTELGHISEAFTRIALSQPLLHLVLRHNGKHVYEVPAAATLPDRIGLFFGQEVRDQLYELEGTAGPVRLHGWIGDPACERGNAKLQYFFLNGRWIRDRTLTHALQESYRGLLMTGRYAVAFLFLEMPPDLVDVNVHPTKAEVRFQDGHTLYHLVLTAIRQRLQRQNLVPHFQLGPRNHASGTGSQPSASMPRLEPAASWSLTPLDASTLSVLPLSDQPPVPQQAPVPPKRQERLEEESSTALPPSPGATSASTDHEPRITNKVMQVHDAYLVVETLEGMLVIDQHALHERILFEQLKGRIQQGTLEKQRLLIPEPIDLPAEQAACVLEQRAALAELGFEVEDFGSGTVLLRGYPALLDRQPPRDIFLAVIDHLIRKERPPHREQFLNELLAVMACRAAVKAGDRLKLEEIAALLAQRDLADNSHHCPHGRPTTLLVSRHELDRQFRRT